MKKRQPPPAKKKKPAKPAPAKPTPAPEPAQAAPIQHTIKAFSRFTDLKQLGLFKNRMTLKRAIEAGLFPPGKRLAGARIWTRGEIIKAHKKLPQ